MTVVLFEEAEVLLEEDKGFVSALHALIMDAKVGPKVHGSWFRV